MKEVAVGIGLVVALALLALFGPMLYGWGVMAGRNEMREVYQQASEADELRHEAKMAELKAAYDRELMRLKNRAVAFGQARWVLSSTKDGFNDYGSAPPVAEFHWNQFDPTKDEPAK